MIRNDFVTVHGIFKGMCEEWVAVPTKEEYDDFRQRVGSVLDWADKKIRALESRITALEEERPTEENIAEWIRQAEAEAEFEAEEEVEGEPKTHTQTWCTPLYGWIEVTGTEEQFTTFMKKLKGGNVTIALALECGLSIKKATK